MNLLITGATGFIGSAVLDRLSKNADVNIKCIMSSSKKKLLSSFIAQVIDDSYNVESVSDLLNDVDVVVHAAAIAHKSASFLETHLESIKSANIKYPLKLAEVSAKKGVKRFIFISSIGVNGSKTDKPFTEKDQVSPHNLYSQTKLDTELGLLDIGRRTGLEIVIIRPPLVYGPNSRGNFALLEKLIEKKIPIPVGRSTKNRRSFIALDNLVDFIAMCVDYNVTPQAANEVFVISDGEDVSTAELFHRVAKAYGKKSRLFHFPLPLLKLGAKLLGKQEMADRLLGSLQVDSSKARELLGWKPVITMEEQLHKMATADLGEQKNSG